MRIFLYFLVTVAAAAVLLYLLPVNLISTDLGNTILTISTVFFGFLAGFFIVVTTTDYNSFKASIASETAAWISLYDSVSMYVPKMKARLSQLIDRYIIRAFDYELLEYTEGTSKEFEEIRKFLCRLPRRRRNAELYTRIRELIELITDHRQQMVVLGERTLSSSQWTVLYLLAAVVVGTLYALRTGELFFDVVTIVVTVSIVLIFILLHDIDLYVWNEKSFGYDVFEMTLVSVGQLPYFPEESIVHHRVHPSYRRYRIGKEPTRTEKTSRIIRVVDVSRRRVHS